jgi:alkanesulfonate monooxygenase SsuD/methylene tetrahydromethanopterin reductase-like flavin-dependent oxidoreductase (luciferase family)
MFSALGFGSLVDRARGGTRRAELAAAIPRELLEQVCAIGNPDRVAGRIADYGEAGADVVGVVPSTAEDPGGVAVLKAVAATGAGRPRTGRPGG